MSGSLARRHDGLMARTVREVLGSVFAPQLRDRIFDEALRRSSQITVPEEAERARDFVEGPLCEAVQELAGYEAAEAVVEGLDPILQMAGSHVRVRDRADDTQVTERDRKSTVPVPAPDDEPFGRAAPRPRVLMATLDRTGIEGVARFLVSVAEVRQVADVFDLVAGMDERGVTPLLVIDCCLPAVDPTTVATMLPVLPPRARVILWGATERMRAELELLSPAVERWIACAPDATHEDLATLLKSLM